MKDHEDLAALFVYGTLKRGQAAHDLILPYVKAVEPASLAGVLYDAGEWPCLMTGEGTVYGELVWVRHRDLLHVLRRLDWFEHYVPDDEPASIYVRRQVIVQSEDGRQLPAETYFYNHDPAGLAVVKDGCWRGEGDRTLPRESRRTR